MNKELIITPKENNRKSNPSSVLQQDLCRFSIKGMRNTKLSEASRTQSKCSKFFVDTRDKNLIIDKDISSLDISQDNMFEIQQSFGFKL